MFNNLFLKFALFFIGGAVIAIGVTQVLPNILTNKQSLSQRDKNQTAYYAESSNQVLGAESELGNKVTQQATNKLQTMTQSVLQAILNKFTQSPAFAPINQTTKDVQSAAVEVQSLPQDQRKAICKEICGGF